MYPTYVSSKLCFALLCEFICFYRSDFFILLSIFTILVVTGSLEYDVVFSLSPSIINLSFYSFGYEFYIIDFICLTLFLGAMGKSAQLGLHT